MTQQIHRQVNKEPSNVQSIQSKAPNKIWQIDTTLLSSDKKSAEYIITLMDVCSKYAWAKRVAVIKNVNNRHGVSSKHTSALITSVIEKEKLRPSTVQSDNGVEFQGVFEATLRALGMNHVRGSVYHSRSQGQIERFNRTLKSLIYKQRTYNALHGISDQHWSDAKLQQVLTMYNNTVHRSTGYKPVDLIRAGDAPTLQSAYANVRHQNEAHQAKLEVAKHVNYLPVKVGDRVRLALIATESVVKGRKSFRLTKGTSDSGRRMFTS